MVLTSIFPPESRQTVLPARSGIRWFRTAASVTAPAPSTSSLVFSSNETIARAISSSSTCTISSTQLQMTGTVRAPGSFTAIPSANVTLTGLSIGLPAAKDADMEGAAIDSTPIMRTWGAFSRMAVAMPAIRPPPPTGMIRLRTSGISSSISRAIVPWPAITSSSSKGWTKSAPEDRW